MNWRVGLARRENQIVREQRGERAKKARDPDLVFLEIESRLKAVAEQRGITLDQLRKELDSMMGEVSLKGDDIALESAAWLGEHYAKQFGMRR